VKCALVLMKFSLLRQILFCCCIQTRCISCCWSWPRPPAHHWWSPLLLLLVLAVMCLHWHAAVYWVWSSPVETLANCWPLWPRCWCTQHGLLPSTSRYHSLVSFRYHYSLRSSSSDDLLVRAVADCLLLDVVPTLSLELAYGTMLSQYHLCSPSENN